MKFFGLEKLSLVDYDSNISATVFTGGCNFRCPFCHNGPLVLDVKNQSVIEEDEILSYLKKRKGVLNALFEKGKYSYFVNVSKAFISFPLSVAVMTMGVPCLGTNTKEGK